MCFYSRNIARFTWIISCPPRPPQKINANSDIKDENLAHCSYEGGILEDPGRTPVSAFDHFLHFGAVSGNVL